MDKKKQMLFNLNNFLLAVTDILDQNESELEGVAKGHSLRIAFISLLIAQQENFSPKEMFDLCAYALFHHYQNEEKLSLLEIDDSSQKLSCIVKYIHNIEKNYNFAHKDIKNRGKIITLLLNDQDNRYAKTLLQYTSKVSFWLDCQSTEVMLQFIYNTLEDFTLVYDFEKVLQITTMFGGLYENVDPLLKIARELCWYYKFEHKDTQTFLIAVSMINFGKLTSPQKILQKKSTLDSEEFEIVKSNVYYLKNALQKIYGFDDITKWASRPHERLDGTGYPYGLSAKDLSLKDRLMSIINIYYALNSKKPYRESYKKDQIIKILHEKGKNGEIDQALIEDLEHYFLK